jgi:hypothetical protein
VDGVTAWLGALCGVRHPSTFVSTLRENDMSYRKITVNDKQYEYVVGKQYTKIKNVGLFKNEDIGTKVFIPQYCDCCGSPLSEIYSSHIDPTGLRVTPADVRRMIESA